MEIKTLEELFIKQYEDLQNELEELKFKLMMKDEELRAYKLKYGPFSEVTLEDSHDEC